MYLIGDEYILWHNFVLRRIFVRQTLMSSLDFALSRNCDFSPNYGGPVQLCNLSERSIHQGDPVFSLGQVLLFNVCSMDWWLIYSFHALTAWWSKGNPTWCTSLRDLRRRLSSLEGNPWKKKKPIKDWEIEMQKLRIILLQAWGFAGRNKHIMWGKVHSQ